MLPLCRCWAAAMLLPGCCYAAAMLLLCCCYAAAMLLLLLCCCRYAKHYLFIAFGSFYSTMPCWVGHLIFFCPVHSLKLYSVSCWTSLSGVISGYISYFSICRRMCLCICFYVFSITLDRLVLCTPSVLCLLLE